MILELNYLNAMISLSIMVMNSLILLCVYTKFYHKVCKESVSHRT